MKVLLTLICILTLSDTIFCADTTKSSTIIDNFCFGLKFGLFLPYSSSNYNFKEDSHRKDPMIDYFLGASAGVVSILNVSNKFNLKTELQYTTFMYTIHKLGNFRDETIRVEEQILELPILLLYTIDESSHNSPKSNTSIFLGPSIGYRLKNKMDYIYYSDLIGSYTNKLNKYALDFCFGFDVTTSKMNIDFRFKYAITPSLSAENNLIRSNNQSAYIKLHSFQINVSYLLFNIENGQYKENY